MLTVSFIDYKDSFSSKDINIFQMGTDSALDMNKVKAPRENVLYFLFFRLSPTRQHVPPFPRGKWTSVSCPAQDNAYYITNV